MYGFLRETQEIADKVGIEKETGLCRTGLDTYLKVIFPKITDWKHDKTTNIIINGKKCLKRPDYCSETLKLIIEIDGLPHYQNPEIILRDIETTEFYESYGYKVVRIPYFIQLTNKAVKQLFNVDVKEDLFPEEYYSLGIQDRCSPAYLCPLGIERMAKEFKLFPEQYKTNYEYLKQFDIKLSGLDYLEDAYNKEI